MKKIFLLFLSIYILHNQAFTQDVQFSQFYGAPMVLNPALTGAFVGKYRISTIYRDQWRSVSPVPLQTYSVGTDLRFELDQKRRAKDVASVGVAFTHDKTSIFSMNSNTLVLSGAFTKALSQDNSQFLTVGIQGGISQRSLNFDNLNFQDEFNGTTGFTLKSFEQLPNNNIAHGDLSTGINYILSPRRGVVYHIGGGAFHLLRPDIAFFEADKGGTAKLPRRYTAHFNASIVTSDRMQISPRVVFQSQGNHMALNAGSNFRMQFSDYGTTAVHFGTWARAVRNTPNAIGFDALVGLVGYEFENFLLGFSYDLNLRSVSKFGAGQNAFEITFGYLGNYDNDTILCPKF